MDRSFRANSAGSSTDAFMSETLHSEKVLGNSDVFRSGKDQSPPSLQTARMATRDKPPANHLRAWREFRGLTQEQLAELADTKGSTISLLESGDRGLGDKWLRKL